MDQDGQFRALCIVIHAGRQAPSAEEREGRARRVKRRWTAPGAAARVGVSSEGELLLSLGESYATLDAHGHPREHLPLCNVVATLLRLTMAETEEEALGQLLELRTWLPELGIPLEPVRDAFVEWLLTTTPTLVGDEATAERIGRLILDDDEGQDMALTVLEENLRRRFRQAERRGLAAGKKAGREEGMEEGMSGLLRKQIARKFGEAEAGRAAGLLAGLGVGDLERADEWIVESSTADELLERLGNGRNG